MFIKRSVLFVIIAFLILSAVISFSGGGGAEAYNPVSYSENSEDVFYRTSYPAMGRFGDVTGDDTVSVGDAIIILRHVVGLVDIKDLDSAAMAKAKVSRGDEGLSVTDAILVLRYVVGLIDVFPAESPWDTEDDATGTIDASGGDIELPDGSRLAFPENTVTETADITLALITPDEQVDDEEKVSSFYSIKGLPDVLSKPVELVVPLNGAVHGETFIVWGEGILGESEHSRILGRQLLPAEVDEERGVAVAVIEPDMGAIPAGGTSTIQSGGSGRDIIYHALTGQATMKSRSGKFATTFSASLIADNFAQVIEDINDALEDTYEFITGEVGMSFEGGRDIIPVSIFEFKNTYMGGYRSEAAWGYAETEKYLSRRSRDYLSINAHMLDHSDAANQLRATAVHELFHLFQYLYVSPPRTGLGSDPVGWLREASSVWLEFQLVEDPSFWPDVVGMQAYFFPLSGLMRPDDSTVGDATQHGYASSLFLKHLTARKGNAAIGRMWDELKAGSSDRRAFEAAFESSIWYMLEWVYFCRDFYGGEYLSAGGALHAWGLNNTSRTAVWNVDDPFKDNYKEFKQNYHSLSAKINIVNLHYADRGFDTGEDGSLVITGDENQSLVVFRKSGDQDVEYLGTTFSPNEPFELQNLGLRGAETLVIVSVADWLGSSVNDTRESVITLEIADLPEVVFTNPADEGSLDTDEDDNLTVTGRMESGTYENPNLSIEDIRIYRYTRINDEPTVGIIRPRKIPVAVGSWNMNSDGTFSVDCTIPDAEQVYALLAVLEFDDEEELLGAVLLGSPDEMEYTSQGETITWSVNGLERIFPYGESGYTFTYERPREGTAPHSVTVTASLTASLWESGKTYLLGTSVRTEGVSGEEGLRDESRHEVEWFEDAMYAPDGPEFNVSLTTNYQLGDSYNILYTAINHHGTGGSVYIPFSIQPAPGFTKDEIINYYHVDTREPDEDDD